MTPLHLVLLAVVLLGGLSAYGLRRAPVRDVHQVLQIGTRALVVLALGGLTMLLVDPADVPSVLRAVLRTF